MRIAMIVFGLALWVAAAGCKKSGGSGEAMAKMTEFKDKMCACKDKACADGVTAEMTKWASDQKGGTDQKTSEADAKKMAALSEEMTKCMTKLMTAATDPGAGSAAQGSGGEAGSAAAGSAAPDGAGDEPKMARGAGNCPSTVLGATTTAELKGKDVVLAIRADDKDAIESIQKRAAELLKEKADDSTPGTGHDHKGTHGGGLGLCPVYFGDGGTAKSKKDAKGVTITITPKDKPDELKKTIDERIAKAADWVKANVPAGDKGNKGGVGGGDGDHGGNHSGKGDGKGKERKGGDGGGEGTGGGGQKGTGGGGGAGGAGSATGGGW